MSSPRPLLGVVLHLFNSRRDLTPVGTLSLLFSRSDFHGYQMPLKYTKKFPVNFSDILIFSATIFLCLLISQSACLFGALLLE
jgi:hypothetical protein